MRSGLAARERVAAQAVPPAAVRTTVPSRRHPQVVCTGRGMRQEQQRDTSSESPSRTDRVLGGARSKVTLAVLFETCRDGSKHHSVLRVYGSASARIFLTFVVVGAAALLLKLLAG